MSEAVQCSCAGAGSLGVLRDVAAAYQQRLRLLAAAAAGDRLQQKQVEVLQSWVKDLSEQNELLARTVEELETDFTSRLSLERRRHSEIESELRAEGSVLRRALWRKDEDVRGLLEVLRRLREFDHCSIDGIHFHEVTESDIFGSVLWHRPNLEHGDTKRNTKHGARKQTKTFTLL